MIWALLEITLPLCLAFLLGITAGWLLWRWRRRFVKASEWDEKSTNIDLQLLRAEHDDLKETRDIEVSRIKTLEGKVESQTIEMRAMDSAARALTEELDVARNKTAVAPPVIDNTAELNKVKAQLAEEKKKAEDAESKTAEFSGRVDHQVQLNNELQQKLKQSESVATERDTAINRIKDLESALALSGQEESDLTEVKEELSVVQKKFKNYQASVVSDRQNNDQEKEKLQLRINELESELTKQQQQAASSEEDKNTISELESRLQESNQRSAELNQTKAENERLKTLVSASAEDKSKISQLESQALELNRRSAEMDRTITALSDMKQEKARLQTRITELESELKNTGNSEEADAAIEELNRAKATIAASDQEKSGLRSRVRELESQLQTTRQQSATLSANDKIKLESMQNQLTQANSAASELNQAKANIATLNTQLNEARMKISQNARTEENLTVANRRNNELMQQYEALKRQTSQVTAVTPDSRQELRELQRKYAEVTAQWNEEKKLSQQLANDMAKLPSSSRAPVTSISDGQLKKLKAQNAAKDERIAELEKKLKNKSAKRKQKNTWQKGKTKLGTPGSDHKDDLTAINGIGPKIEKVLNKQGLKSWEQLAFLSAAEITMVDEALTDFPGRIKRDKWVPQAKAILRNGHQPLKKNTKTKPKSKSTKKPKRNKSAKKAWQQGETRFGTPGSIHRDDLKVINGIGPVIEKALNRRGVRSWEQLATLKAQDVKTIDEALDFPGRIKREQWVQQAKALVKQFPDHKDRPKRTTFLNKVANG